jgi:hypothetical protein
VSIPVRACGPGWRVEVCSREDEGLARLDVRSSPRDVEVDVEGRLSSCEELGGRLLPPCEEELGPSALLLRGGLPPLRLGGGPDCV